MNAVTREAPAWHHAAACAGLPEPLAALFFGTEDEQRRAAVEWCGRCDVRDACRLAHSGEPFGTWGGITEKVRWSGVRRRARLA